MQCKYRQSDIPDNSKFCSQCGKSVSEAIPSFEQIPPKPKISFPITLLSLILIINILLGILGIFYYTEKTGVFLGSIAIAISVICLVEI